MRLENKVKENQYSEEEHIRMYIVFFQVNIDLPELKVSSNALEIKSQKFDSYMLSTSQKNINYPHCLVNNYFELWTVPLKREQACKTSTMFLGHKMSLIITMALSFTQYAPQIKLSVCKWKSKMQFFFFCGWVDFDVYGVQWFHLKVFTFW